MALSRRGLLLAVHSHKVYFRIRRSVCRESLLLVYRLRCRVKTFFFFRFCAITCGIYLCISRIFRASLVSIFVSVATLKYSFLALYFTIVGVI